MIIFLRSHFSRIWRKLFRVRMIRLLRYDQLLYDVCHSVINNQIEGDYLEFGVYRGETVAKVFHYMKDIWITFRRDYARHVDHLDLQFFQRKRFFAFDSFEGLPQAGGGDTPVQFTKGVFGSPQSIFTRTLIHQGVDLEKIVVVPGWFDQTLDKATRAQHRIERACLIFIDCDLYESAVPIFQFLTPLIHEGTVLVIDDFFRYKGNPAKGLQRAYYDWLRQNPHISTLELARCAANQIAFICHVNPAKESTKIPS